MYRTQPYVPRANQIDPGGLLYYVRLQTPYGRIYKLGFTSLGSVHERLAYQGKGHEKLIDAVLFTVKYDDALLREQCLHSYFKSKSLIPVPDQDMPLFGNGQSELYAEDILGLDPTYTDGHRRAVESAIQARRLQRLGKSKSEIAARAAEDEKSEQFMRDLDASIGRVFRLYKRLHDWLLGPRKTPPSRSQEMREAARAGENRKPLALDPDEVLTDIKEIGRQYERTEEMIRLAIAALKSKDTETFERLVSTLQFAHNLTSALRGLYWHKVCQLSGWKPRLTETGFDTATLKDCDVSSWGGIFPPVLDAYQKFLLEYVGTHILESDEIVLPQERLPGHEVLNEHFRPSIFLDLLGRKWTFPDAPAFIRGTWFAWGKFGRTDFPVSVYNELTGVTTAVTLRCLVQPNSLCIGFTNLAEILLERSEQAKGGFAAAAVGLQPCAASAT